MQGPFPHYRHARPSMAPQWHAAPGPSPLDQSVDGFRHRLQTDAQRRTRVAAKVTGSALLSLCALVVIISLLANTVFGGGGGATRGSQTPPNGSGPQNGSATLPTATPTIAQPTLTATPTIARPTPPVVIPTTRAPAGGPDTAHLVRSINIGEYGCGDPFVSDATLRAMVASHHIPYIRVPFRDGCSDQQYLETLHAIVSIGAVPQVITHGNCTNSASQQAEGDHWLTLVDQASPNGVYWVEYGNEEDIGCGTGGISVQQYVAGWNRDVPLFRAHHPRARFIGPVTAGHNTGWINYLLANGTPHPDAISWHWYPCGAGATDSQCLINTAHIDNDIAQTDAAMATIGVTVPIWLTEWDESYTSDARFGNQAYIQNWMALALQHLTHLHTTANLAVAEFYVLTNGSATSNSDLFTPPPADALNYIGAAFFVGI